MKIGLVSFHSFFQPGGVKNHIFGLYNEFKKKGIKTKIIVPRRKRNEYYHKDVILLGTSFPINFSGSEADLDVNFNPISVERVLKRENFDILHFHNFGFPSALQILFSSPLSTTLNILTFHANIEENKLLKNFPGILNMFNMVCQWKIDGIIGVSSLCLNVFKKYKKPKIIIPNGVDLTKFNPHPLKSTNLPYSKDKINILFVGRIEKRKGLIYLLKAFKILEKKFSQKIRLIVVGDGNLRKDSENYVKRNNLKEVYFEGRVSDTLPYYKTADIFVSPAIFGESFGIVLLEAMASGIPFVAFANKGYKEFLKSSPAEKFLVNPRDYHGLSEKIEFLIEHPDIRKKIAFWGQKESQKYAWPKIADRVLKFYHFCQKAKEKKTKSS